MPAVRASIFERNLYWWPAFFLIRDVMFKEKSIQQKTRRSVVDGL